MGQYTNSIDFYISHSPLLLSFRSLSLCHSEEFGRPESKTHLTNVPVFGMMRYSNGFPRRKEEEMSTGTRLRGFCLPDMNDTGARGEEESKT